MATALVFVVVLVTKFAEGAWIVVLAAPILFMAMKGVSRPLQGAGLAAETLRRGAGSARRSIHSVVLVSNLLAPTLQALLSLRRVIRRHCGRSRSRPRTPGTSWRPNGVSVAFPFRLS